MNPRHFARKPEGPFMVLNAPEIEQYKRLERVFAFALILVQDNRFERELATPGTFQNLGKAVRDFMETKEEGF